MMDDISMQGVFPTLIALMNGGFESGPLEGCDDAMLAGLADLAECHKLLPSLEPIAHAFPEAARLRIYAAA